MDPDQIKNIIEHAISDTTRLYPLYIVITIIVSVVTLTLTNFLKTKSENLAMRQDIRLLTQKVEDVKSEYAKQLEKFKGGQQIRNMKIKELYDKTIKLKSLILNGKNELNTTKIPEIFELIKDLLVSMNSDVIFSKNLLYETKIIETDYNNCIKLVIEAQGRNVQNCELNFDMIVTTIDAIQEKILDQ